MRHIFYPRDRSHDMSNLYRFKAVGFETNPLSHAKGLTNVNIRRIVDYYLTF